MTYPMSGEAIEVVVKQGDRVLFVGRLQPDLGDTLSIDAQDGQPRVLRAIVHDLSAAVVGGEQHGE